MAQAIGIPIFVEEFVPRAHADTPVAEAELQEYILLHCQFQLRRWRERIDAQLSALDGGFGVLMPCDLATQAIKCFTAAELLLVHCNGRARWRS